MSQNEIDHVMKPAILELKKLGWMATHPSPPTDFGFPDILCAKGKCHILIEVKDFTGVLAESSAQAQFTPYQIPWMVLNCEKSSNIFLLIKYNNDYFAKNINSHEEAFFLTKARVIDMRKFPIKCDSVKVAVHAIIANVSDN